MPKLERAEIAAIVQAGIDRIGGAGSASRLSRERTDVKQFYDAQSPKQAHASSINYNSMNVYYGTESMKAQLLEVFSGNSRPVRFVPAPEENEAAARFRTDYVTYVIFSQNPGFKIFQAIMTDGLLGRNGICKVWWESNYSTENYEIAKPTEEQIIGFLTKDPTARVVAVERGDEDGPLERVRFMCKRNRSQVRIAPLPPEEFGISPCAPSIDEADLVYHRQSLTRSDLIKQGYPRNIVDTLQADDGLEMATDPEFIQRFAATTDAVGTQFDSSSQHGKQRFTLYECYLELDVEGDGRTQLHKVDICGGQILDMEPVNRRPFIDFCPLPRSHDFWGVNYAALLIPTQRAQTHLARAIIDHAMITSNPRYMVANGGLTNPRELMENRLGGIVNVRNVMDSVAPLPQPSLNPFVFQTMAQISANGEEISGISSLSQGLNKDAISTQNSQAMIQDLITVSQTRQKIVARNFAEGFLRKLYSVVYRLVIENEEPNKLVQASNGAWQMTDFTQWPEDTEMVVSFALGYGEQAQEANKWLEIDQYLANPANGLQSLYPIEKRHFVLSRVLENKGIKDADSLILSPDKVPPPQPDPAVEADLQVKQADAKVKMANAEAATENIKLKQLQAHAEHEAAMAKLMHQQMKTDGDQQLKRDKLAHEIALDRAELALSEEALAKGEGFARVSPG